MEVVAVCTLVAKIASIIGLFEKIATTYAWLKKVASTKWKKELDKYIKYLRLVKNLTRRYKHSNRSETLITEALKLLDEELEESWSKVDKWIQTEQLRADNFIDKWLQTKQLRADDFIKELKSSKTTIAQYLEAFRMAVQEEAKKREKEREKKKKREEKEREEKEKRERQRRIEREEKERRERQRRKEREEKERRERQRRKEREEKERKERQRRKEREESEYKAWLRKNVTKLTDSWTRYKGHATNFKLDPEKKKRLFREHMEGLREKYPRQYRQLLENQNRKTSI